MVSGDSVLAIRYMTPGGDKIFIVLEYEATTATQGTKDGKRPFIEE